MKTSEVAAQAHGFTLDDIEDLLHLAEGGPDSCPILHDIETTVDAK